MSWMTVLGIGAAGAAVGVVGTLAYQKYVSGDESAEELDQIAAKLQDMAERKRQSGRAESRRAPARQSTRRAHKAARKNSRKPAPATA